MLVAPNGDIFAADGYVGGKVARRTEHSLKPQIGHHRHEAVRQRHGIAMLSVDYRCVFWWAKA